MEEYYKINYRTLQKIAKEYKIRANQKRETLIQALVRIPEAIVILDDSVRKEKEQATCARISKIVHTKTVEPSIGHVKINVTEMKDDDLKSLISEEFRKDVNISGEMISGIAYLTEWLPDVLTNLENEGPICNIDVSQTQYQDYNHGKRQQHINHRPYPQNQIKGGHAKHRQQVTSSSEQQKPEKRTTNNAAVRYHQPQTQMQQYNNNRQSTKRGSVTQSTGQMTFQYEPNWSDISGWHCSAETASFSNHMEFQSNFFFPEYTSLNSVDSDVMNLFGQSSGHRQNNNRALAIEQSSSKNAASNSFNSLLFA